MTLNRRVAALATLTLATAGLVGVAAQPASAADDVTLQWGVSQYLNEHLTAQSFTDGATESAAGVVTFVDGVTVGDTTKYRGSASYAFASFYSFTFSDLALTVDDAGDGTIAADVAWTSPSGAGSVSDAVLTTFSTEDDWSDGSLTGTPDWAGVAPADTYGSGKPVGGASWAVDFVKAIPSDINPFYYASGSANDGKKPPAAFTATAPADQAGPTVAVESTYVGRAVEITVDGTGFDPVLNPPREDGIYVALAPAGSSPQTLDFEERDTVPASAYLPDASLSDGTFSVTLKPENEFLDPSVQYAVFTWQAHLYSNPNSDTETPVEIMWSNLAGPTTLGAKVAKAPTTKKAGKLTLTVTGDETPARGKVMVMLTKKGEKAKHLTGKVVDGAGTVKLPKLAKGTWKAKAEFLPSTAAYKSATKTLSVKVK